jgi:biopolymer transport protein ExbD
MRSVVRVLLSILILCVVATAQDAPATLEVTVKTKDAWVIGGQNIDIHAFKQRVEKDRGETLGTVADAPVYPLRVFLKIAPELRWEPVDETLRWLRTQGIIYAGLNVAGKRREYDFPLAGPIVPPGEKAPVEMEPQVLQGVRVSLREFEPGVVEIRLDDQIEGVVGEAPEDAEPNEAVWKRLAQDLTLWQEMMALTHGEDNLPPVTIAPTGEIAIGFVMSVMEATENAGISRLHLAVSK